MYIISEKVLTMGSQNFQYKVHLPRLLKGMNEYSVGNKVFYELLCVEFTKLYNQLTLQEKKDCLYIFANADVEANTLI